MPTISMGKSPKPEQSKTVTPTAAGFTVTPDAGKVLSSVVVNGDADLVTNNIKSGVNIFGVAGNSNVVDTSAGDATAAQILSGKKAYVDGALVTGTIPSKTAQTYTPGTSNQTISAGQYLSGVQTISGDADLVTGNIKSGANIFGVAGKSSVVETSDATAAAGDMLSGKTGYVNGAKITGTIASKGAQTYTPGTSNQTIAAGQYLSGAQTIAGDADLVAANIKSGVNIFGVAGTCGIQAGTTVALTKATIACEYIYGTSWKKLLEYTVALGGIYRIRYSVSNAASKGMPETFRVYAQVYRNGVPAGSLNSAISYEQVYLEEDLYFAAGQSLQFYGKGAVYGNEIYCIVRNITVKYLAPTFTLTYERSSP